MWMKNSVDPDQLASLDLDLHCFQKRAYLKKTAHSGLIRLNKVIYKLQLFWKLLLVPVYICDLVNS